MYVWMMIDGWYSLSLSLSLVSLVESLVSQKKDHKPPINDCDCEKGTTKQTKQNSRCVMVEMGTLAPNRCFVTPVDVY